MAPIASSGGAFCSVLLGMDGLPALCIMLACRRKVESADSEYKIKNKNPKPSLSSERKEEGRGKRETFPLLPPS